MTARIAEAVSLQNRLRQALDQKQFVLYYQPKINAVTRRITGLEALLRWNDPDSGLVSPDKFITLLEKSGMILDVGLWVLEQATRDYLMWEQRLPEVPRIAVNVSELQLQQDDFVTRVIQATTTKGKQVPFELEITESLIMKDVENSIDKLVTLQKSGLSIAIDDFGTGYSSLSHIARLPLDALKIDRTFVDSMLTNPESGIIVETIISMAHTLNLKVVAEGVETEAQAARLRELHCEELQGFLFSKPLPVEELWPLLSGKTHFDMSMDKGHAKEGNKVINP
jgi:EAL domain-containing protein (putative c-di-GMP-specific phosphodiesterase class I)